MYCRQELPHAFRTAILPIASVITPNQFEAELLAEMPIKSEQDAIAACAILHSKGPHTVIITSLNLDPNWVTVIASTTIKQIQEHQEGNNNSTNSSQYTQYKLRVRRVEAYFTGTGDLFTALLLGWMQRCPENIKSALEHAVSGL